MRRRPLRNTAGWLAANALRLAGKIERAHAEALASEAVVNVYFHNPCRELFVRLTDWFGENGYRFLSADDLLELRTGGARFPKGAVSLSFDDAWRGNLSEVIPVVRASKLPVTIFVPTAEVRRGHFWFSEAQRHPELLPEPFRSNVRLLWEIPEATRRALVEQLFQRVERTEREVMSESEIQEIARMPEVTIGSHSVHHAIMPNCDDQLLRAELAESKRELECWTGRPVRFFSYPNGDFDARAGAVLAETGYELGFTTENRVMTAADNPFYLPRYSVMDDGSFIENLCHALGLWRSFLDSGRRWTGSKNGGPSLRSTSYR